MTTSRHDNQPCWLISLTGSYLTPNGTFSADPTHALIAERWWMQREQTRLNASTLIIRALTPSHGTSKRR
jgi:hypothetical protein